MQKHHYEASSKIERKVNLIRCFEDCVDSFTSSNSIPLAICYQPSKIYCKLDINSNNHSQDNNIYLFEKPCEDISTYYSYLNNFTYLNSEYVINFELIDYLVTNSCIRINTIGRWILVTKIKLLDSLVAVSLRKPLWLLKYSYDTNNLIPQMVEINYTEHGCTEKTKTTEE